MPIIKTIAFGRLWRYVCDGPKCEDRSTIPPDHAPPPGWKEHGELVTCPTCEKPEAKS